jgi:SAM-dependent methyltransferase
MHRSPLSVDDRRLFAWRMEDERQRNAARARVLSEWLPKGGVGAELGVFQGRFSRTLLDLTDANRLHLIDPWYFLTAEWHWGWGNRNTVETLVQILMDFKPEIETARVLVHVADDVPTLREFPNAYFDWVYIDSSHQYEHTVKELDVLGDKVKPEGIIAGDDWRPDPAHKHHGVCRAVIERVSTGTYTLLGADEKTTQWAIRRHPQSKE